MAVERIAQGRTPPVAGILPGAQGIAGFDQQGREAGLPFERGKDVRGQGFDRLQGQTAKIVGMVAQKIDHRPGALQPQNSAAVTGSRPGGGKQIVEQRRISRLDQQRPYARHELQAAVRLAPHLGHPLSESGRIDPALGKKGQEPGHRISRRYRWVDPDGDEVDFLSDDEIENLTIRHGTLTAAEREMINYHIVATIKMLESLPWPKHLKNVPEYAGGHHERVDGRGYPRGLTCDEMSVQARIMGIADIFEALTARDRPYKSGMKLSEALRILENFSRNGHIDPDLHEVFVRRKVYMEYAREYLDPAQIDVFD